MVNKNRWIYNYNGLDSDDQLEIAASIISELRDNEEFLDDEEYEKEKSKKIRELLNKILLSTNQNKELQSTIEKFEKLSQENKEKVVTELFRIISMHSDTQKHDASVQTCREEGHSFSKWVEKRLTKTVTIGDSGIESLFTGIGTREVKYKEWHRTCERCGFVEVTDSEPQELIDARKEKNRKSRVRKLENELKRLKGKDE